MPRPRKYDYQKDYPVRLFITVRVEIMNQLEELGMTQKDVQDYLTSEIEHILRDYVEKNRKND